MADDNYRKEYPQQSRPDDTHSRPQSHYPPPPDTTQWSSGAPPSSMATSDTLPSIRDSCGYGAPPAAQGRGYPDPRYAYPHAVNGCPPPSHHAPPGQFEQYLPPLQPQSDARSLPYPPPPPDQRGGYYNERRPYGQEPYGSDPYYAYYRGQPPPQGSPPPNGHPGYRHNDTRTLDKAVRRL